MKNDRDIILDFISEVGSGEEDTGALNSNLIYIPKRVYAVKERQAFIPYKPWSGNVDKDLRFVFNYIKFDPINKLAKNFSIEPAIDDLNRSIRIPERWMNIILSNIYLYFGYVRHVLLKHLTWYLEDREEDIKIAWKEFSPTSSTWNSPFTFQVSPNVKTPYSIYDFSLFDDFRATKKRKGVTYYHLYHSEVLELKEAIGRISKLNMIYYLLIRDVSI